MPSVCFTGRGLRISGTHYTRSQWETLASQFNYDVRDKVDYGLTYLVMADPRSTSSKAVRARTIGTQTISYHDFERLVLAGQRPGGNARPVSQADIDRVVGAVSGRPDRSNVAASVDHVTGSGTSNVRRTVRIQVSLDASRRYVAHQGSLMIGTATADPVTIEHSVNLHLSRLRNDGITGEVVWTPGALERRNMPVRQCASHGSYLASFERCPVCQRNEDAAREARQRAPLQPGASLRRSRMLNLDGDD